MSANWFIRLKDKPATQAVLGKAGVVLFFALLIFILFIPIKSYFNFYDEGFAVFNATRLLNHEAPYRDFWAIYPPGQLYILAGVFKLFGVSLDTSRVYDTLVRAVLVLGIFLVATKITTRKFAFVVTLALTAGPGFAKFLFLCGISCPGGQYLCALQRAAIRDPKIQALAARHRRDHRHRLYHPLGYWPVCGLRVKCRALHLPIHRDIPERNSLARAAYAAIQVAIFHWQ